MTTAHRRTANPRILVVLAHFDETRNPHGRPNFVPQGVGHAFLAGAFSRTGTQVKIYSEFHSGPLQDEKLLSWPDMLVLTGVTSSFDRMRQITAYTRTLVPHAVVVAGGPVVRNLPTLSKSIFDYACTGDIEELRDVAGDVFGEEAIAPRMEPRFDLLNWRSPVNYVESSRYCNFRCSFCALTGEGRQYQKYDLKYIENQIISHKDKKYLMFIDNNFYGNNFSAFHSKLDLLSDLWRQGHFKGWMALVTADFFKQADNLQKARDAGCIGLFSGVESFDDVQLKRYQKKQNLATPQLESIEECLRAGIGFVYGMIFDPSTERLLAMQRQLEFILQCHKIPLPGFLSLTIPLIGTPFFYECLADNRFLPNAKLRDMDGFTLMTRPLDPIDQIVPFARQLGDMGGSASKILKHCYKFYRTYRRDLSSFQMTNLIANGARLCCSAVMNNRRHCIGQFKAENDLTYITTSQPLGPLYRPFFPVSEKFRDYFMPTMITDESGNLHEMVADDLDRSRATQRAVGAR
jgi:hopanoid C-2 methylase